MMPEVHHLEVEMRTALDASWLLLPCPLRPLASQEHCLCHDLVLQKVPSRHVQATDQQAAASGLRAHNDGLYVPRMCTRQCPDT